MVNTQSTGELYLTISQLEISVLAILQLFISCKTIALRKCSIFCLIFIFRSPIVVASLINRSAAGSNDHVLRVL